MVSADFESLEKDGSIVDRGRRCVPAADLLCRMWLGYERFDRGTLLARRVMELMHHGALVECAGYLAVLPGRGFGECLLAEVRAVSCGTIKTRARSACVGALRPCWVFQSQL